MKKMLSTLGALAILAGAGSTAIVLSNTTTQQNFNNIQNLDVHNNPNLAQLASDDEVDKSMWSKLNDLIDLGFHDSNDYKPWVETYKNSWIDFGWRVVFPEGDVNVMRLVQMVNTAYNQVNFQPVEDLLDKVDPLFTYLQNINDHGNDKVIVLSTMLDATLAELQASPIPFNANFIDTLSSLAHLLSIFKNRDLSVIDSMVVSQVENLFGMTLDQMGEKFNALIKVGHIAIVTANTTLQIFKETLPAVVFNQIMNNTKTVSDQMVSADEFGTGVEWKVDKYIFFVGFAPHQIA